MNETRGLLVVVSGPSGVGKGTIMRPFMERNKNVKYSVSATTRAPREGEIDGVNYHFVTKEQFEKLIENDEMLEWARYGGNYYGTPRFAVERGLAAGLDVGVYFFSQATSVLEAEEEADFVLAAVRGYPIKYPVAFDWEFIDGAEARTDGMDGDTVTQCAAAFCELVSVAGYTPMVYFNQELGYRFYQLDQLDASQFWLAEYDTKPDFFYDFEMWQYTSSGRVAGISGDVDLNLRFFRDGSKDDLTEVWKDPDGREDPQEEIQEVPQEEQEDSGKDSQEGQQPSQDIPQ